ncbi:MAG: hypothetical protein CM1200mP10_14150 [Candidatus Neomarinimicrobiota bacterium]|nr:MAG: hypothetical protein CM1200mP10_14150 [Candidatus Neomarinimicrobiota bacterium]
MIVGCGDLTNFSIYLSDGSLVAAVDTNYYTHESLTNGTEYCYYVVANYSGGASTLRKQFVLHQQVFHHHR